MSPSLRPFHKHLDQEFIEALDALVDDKEKGRWWCDVLCRKDLKIAIRDNCLDVYHSGAAIFRITFKGGRVVARTHFKYLVRQMDAYASIACDGKTFDREAKAEFWAAYEGHHTLKEMIAAAKPFSGLEKSGLHPLILYQRVVDLEVAFWSVADSELGPPPPTHGEMYAWPGVTNSPTKGSKHRHDRLDAATLEERDGELWIVFHEAKHFTNPGLRSGPLEAPFVIGQIGRYRGLLEQRSSEIKTTYQSVACALRALHEMRAKADPTGASAAAHWDRLIERAADGEALHIDPEPRLIVFGFDGDQKQGSWKQERQRLEKENLTVYAVGMPTTKGAAAAFKWRGRSGRIFSGLK